MRVTRMAAVALTAAALAACGDDAAGGGPMVAVIDTVHARGEDVPDVVTAIGTVEAEHQTVVSAEVQGQVARILRDEGSEVSRGVPVVQLDASPYRFAAESAAASLAQARVQLTNDERLLTRYEQLLAAGAIDQQTYDDLQARVESGRAAVRQAQAALNTARWNVARATVTAPFTGTVGRRHVQLGQFVDAQDPVFDIVDDQPVKIRFQVPEIHIDKVAVGDPVEFRVRSDTVGTRIARIDYVSPEIDPGTRSFEVTAEYSNPDGGAHPGAFADITVTTAVLEDAPVVPEEAVYTEGTDNYVYVVEDSTASRRKVEIVRRIDGDVVLAGGVRPGEAVITAGHYGLPDGARVRVAPREDRTLERES